MGIIFLRSGLFDAWLKGLKDRVGKARILARIRSAELGAFGDCAPVGEGVFEMRVHVGPGYRIYYTGRGVSLYVLLAGGDTSSQRRDISKAIAMAREIEKE
jgi:putative addiction module killer protein